MRALLLSGAIFLAGFAGAAAETIQPAAPIDRPPPDYPIAADNAEGFVKLRFTITKDGHVAGPAVIESSPPGVFDASAVAAVQRWSFRPRLVDGRPADQPDTMIMIRFKPPENAGPVWLNPSPPLYPREAFTAKVQGTVKVGFDIEPTGATANVRVLEASAPGVFDAEAIHDVEGRIYQPPMAGGQPQAAGGQTTVIEYKLADALVRPKPTHIVKPTYPEGSYYVNGFCAMDLSIADDGSVSKAVIEQTFPQRVFERNCMSAVTKWRFETRAELGAPAAQHIKYMISFRTQRGNESEVHYLKPGQWIELEYTRTAEGRTKDIKVVGQSEPGLPVGKAVEQLKDMKFEPIVQNGAPVEVPNLKIRIN